MFKSFVSILLSTLLLPYATIWSQENDSEEPNPALVENQPMPVTFNAPDSEKPFTYEVILPTGYLEESQGEKKWPAFIMLLPEKQQDGGALSQQLNTDGWLVFYLNRESATAKECLPYLTAMLEDASGRFPLLPELIFITGLGKDSGMLLKALPKLEAIKGMLVQGALPAVDVKADIPVLAEGTRLYGVFGHEVTNKEKAIFRGAFGAKIPREMMIYKRRNTNWIQPIETKDALNWIYQQYFGHPKTITTETLPQWQWYFDLLVNTYENGEAISQFKAIDLMRTIARTQPFRPTKDQIKMLKGQGKTYQQLQESEEIRTYKYVQTAMNGTVQRAQQKFINRVNERQGLGENFTWHADELQAYQKLLMALAPVVHNYGQTAAGAPAKRLLQSLRQECFAEKPLSFLPNVLAEGEAAAKADDIKTLIQMTNIYQGLQPTAAETKKLLGLISKEAEKAKLEAEAMQNDRSTPPEKIIEFCRIWEGAEFAAPLVEICNQIGSRELRKLMKRRTPPYQMVPFLVKWEGFSFTEETALKVNDFAVERWESLTRHGRKTPNADRTVDFYERWNGLPVIAENVQKVYDQHAKQAMNKASSLRKPEQQADRLKSFSKAWPYASNKGEAQSKYEELTAKMLEEIKAIAEERKRKSELKSFARAYGETAAGKEAHQLLEAF